MIQSAGLNNALQLPGVRQGVVDDLVRRDLPLILILLGPKLDLAPLHVPFPLHAITSLSDLDWQCHYLIDVRQRHLDAGVLALAMLSSPILDKHCSSSSSLITADLPFMAVLTFCHAKL